MYVTTGSYQVFPQITRVRSLKLFRSEAFALYSMNIFCI